MSAVVYENPNTALVRRGVDWGAIWAGVFIFAAIWSVFETLGAAIFATTANASTTHAVSGTGVGMGIWTVILTIVAMYIAGLETGRLAAVANRRDGTVHGMAMFGLSMVAALAILIVGSSGMVTGTQFGVSVRGPYFLSMVSGFGWFGFLSLFLGWLAAMGGASAGSRRKIEPEKNVQPIRNAA
jgi:hypothetical protein